MPAAIEKIESDIETLQQQMNEPEFFSQYIDITQPVMEQAGALEEQLMSYLSVGKNSKIYQNRVVNRDETIF